MSSFIPSLSSYNMYRKPEKILSTLTNLCENTANQSIFIFS